MPTDNSLILLVQQGDDLTSEAGLQAVNDATEATIQAALKDKATLAALTNLCNSTEDVFLKRKLLKAFSD